MYLRIGKEGGPDPFEAIQLPFLFFGGLSTLTGFGAPTSIVNVLPSGILTVWCVLLCFSAAIGAIGVFWIGRETTALMIEEIGLIGLVGASLIYAVSLLAQLGYVQGAAVVTSFVIGLGIQSVWRVWEIIRSKRRLVMISQYLSDEGVS